MIKVSGRKGVIQYPGGAMPESEKKVSKFKGEGLRLLDYGRSGFPSVSVFEKITGPFFEDIVRVIFLELNLFPCVLDGALYLSWWECCNCHFAMTQELQCPVGHELGSEACFKSFEPQFFRAERVFQGDWLQQIKDKVGDLGKYGSNYRRFP
jgi:hypothetical protein